MVTYTKEQNELVKQIRELQQKEKMLDYEQTLLFNKLIEEANSQNLCWW